MTILKISAPAVPTTKGRDVGKAANRNLRLVMLNANRLIPLLMQLKRLKRACYPLGLSSLLKHSEKYSGQGSEFLQ